MNVPLGSSQLQDTCADLGYECMLGKKYVNIPSEKYIYVHIYVCICVYTYLCKMDEYWSYAGWS